MHILHVVGARPNFMKAAPVIGALAQRESVRQTLVHTGQHYDFSMSDVFFQELGMPQPDFNLDVRSGTHATQTAEVMSRFESVVLDQKPDLVLVYGDVNSTVAAALVCAKLLVPVGHVEAGLRSFDRTMPEEINRLLTDQIADMLFTPSSDGNENLAREGIDATKIHLVGNVMIDTLVLLLDRASEKWDPERIGIGPNAYGLVTLHRPSNVDEVSSLKSVFSTLKSISEDVPLVFPIHPRTRQRLEEYGIPLETPGLTLLEPMGYLDFLAAQAHAMLVITDSGGVQEETTYLNIPCLTVRDSTERPVTVTTGSNVLVGTDMGVLKREVARILDGDGKKGLRPPLWDGHAANRIAELITT